MERINGRLWFFVNFQKHADKKVCRFELSCDQYQSIYNLIQYYQMETRWRIKTLILQAFKALCYLDKNAIEVLLMSVLPLELVINLLSDTKQNVQWFKIVNV